MEVELRCQLKTYRPSRPRLQRLADLVKKKLRLRAQRVSLWLTNDGTMRRINSEHRGKHSTTDVLSFPALPVPGGAESCLGDVVISVQRARRQAAREGHSLARELDWLWLHGLLHLSGYDHETDQGEMTALEYKLRKAWEKKA